jgi:WD40 repeat protein
MLAAAGDDRSIMVWEVNSGVEVARFSGTRGRIYGLAFSPDGRWLATGGGETEVKSNAFGEVTLWDVEARARAVSFDGHARAVLALAFSPDGQTLATSGFDATVHLWDRATGHSKLVIGGLPCWAQSLAFSPDGRMLALGGRGDAIVALHDAASGAEVGRLVGHCGVVRDLAFSPDGRSLATAGTDRVIKLWELPLSKPSASSLAGRPPSGTR